MRQGLLENCVGCTLRRMIETDRLLLRQYALTDHPQYVAMCSDPEVMRFVGGKPLPPEDVWNRILRYAGHWQLLGFGIFAVFEKDTGQYIGETGIADFHRGLGPEFDNSREAGWIFTTRVHGRGYAFEAADAVHSWYDASRNSPRTVCIIHPDNAASLRMAAKLGYTPFGETQYKDAPVVMLERIPTAI